MVRIVGAHRIELQALGAFASRGTNRVVIIPGNHDGAIAFPSVRNLVLLAARPARPSTFEFATEGRWISPTANIVVEHGHQLDDANKFADWPNPIAAAPSGTLRIRSPFGEALVREFFDPLEKKHPVVDNITGGAGIMYGVKREGMVGTAKVFTDFVKLLSLDTSWRQFSEFLGEESVKPPVWDVAETRKDPVAFLVNSLPPDDPEASLVRELLASPDQAMAAAAANSVAALSDEDIRTICQSRYVSRQRQEIEGVPENQLLSRCVQSGGDLGYLKQKTVQRVRGSMYYVSQHLNSVVANLPGIKDKPDPVVYVYGHTHAASRAATLRDSRFTVINTGAWQRLIKGETVAALAKEKGWQAAQVIDNLTLRDLPPCYSFVWIPFELGKPLDPKLRYWTSDGDVWKFTTSCGKRETLPPE